MIAVDTNILVYSHREQSPHHEAAKAAIEGLRNSVLPWAIPWPCVLEFISISTHPKIYYPPSTLSVAFAALESWQAGGNLRFLSEGETFLEKLREVALRGKIRGPRIHDARIAALCLSHGIKELWSADRDFLDFPSLATRNPLQG
jgi:toxin-antitoxin system PIN domain toxin